MSGEKYLLFNKTTEKNNNTCLSDVVRDTESKTREFVHYNEQP